MTDTNTHTLTLHEPSTVAPVAPAWNFDELWRAANAFAGSRMVPAHFQNQPQDCFVVVQLALELGIAPLTALQNIFMISGRPGFSAKLAIALANRSGAFAGPIRYNVDRGDGKRESLAVTAYAPTKDGEVVEVTITMAQAMADGWTKNPKYKSIPEQMLRLRAAKWLIDLHCPEILLGLDIAEDSGYKSHSATPQRTSTGGIVDTQPQGLEAVLQQKIAQKTEVVITEENDQPLGGTDTGAGTETGGPVDGSP